VAPLGLDGQFDSGARREVKAAVVVVKAALDGHEAVEVAHVELDARSRSSATNAAGEGPGRTNAVAAPTQDILGRIAQHLADATLKVSIQQTYDLAQARQAMQALAANHTRGKLALRVA
jgi:NADPH:quinone reductase